MTWQRAGGGFGESSGGRGSGIFRDKYDIGAERAEFGGEAALGVDLKIQQRCGHCRASSKRQQNDEQSSAIGSKNSPDHAPEHFATSHHSPRRIGAGSSREARPRGIVL